MLLAVFLVPESVLRLLNRQSTLDNQFRRMLSEAEFRKQGQTGEQAILRNCRSGSVMRDNSPVIATAVRYV